MRREPNLCIGTDYIIVGEINLNKFFFAQHIFFLSIPLLRHLTCISHCTCFNAYLHKIYSYLSSGKRNMALYLECKDFYSLDFGCIYIELLIKKSWTSSGFRNKVQENILGSCLISGFFLSHSFVSCSNCFRWYSTPPYWSSIDFSECIE
jgi:hypothetical protein